MDSIEKFFDEVETVNGFCYLRDRLRWLRSGGHSKSKIGWVRFKERRELLLGNSRCCIRSAILYGSEAWCLKENRKAILRRTERAIVRAMWDQKFVDRKTTE